MEVLVTGGAGFIGSHTVVELHQKGYKPVIIDNFSNSEKSALKGIENITGQSFPFYEGNCNDQAFVDSVFAKHIIDGVIHFAASKAVGESVSNPIKYYENNLCSIITLVHAMRKAGVSKMVFSSSCTVYGEPDYIPVDEKAERKPANSPYGNTKAIAEDMLRDMVISGENMQLISLRYFNPIGAHESAEIGELPAGVPSNLVPYITQTAIGKREKLTVFGNDYDTVDGTNIRDFIHVVDLAQAHIAALDLLKNKSTAYYDVFNIGTGRGNSVLELIDTFERVNNVKLNYSFGPRRPGDTIKIYGEVSKASSVLGWQTKKTLEDALKDAWRWEQKLAQK